MVTPKWLLVDDDEDDREIFQMALTDAAPEVKLDTAANGPEALKKLTSAESNPSVIFLDINMPWMNGFECLKKIKADATLKKVNVYMYSTSENPADAAMAKELGAAGYICKPADVQVLTLKLKELAERGRL